MFASGPIVEIPLDEFRTKGHDWVQRHFQEFQAVRVARERIIKVFQRREAEKAMRDRQVVQIHLDPNQSFIFSPMVVGKYTLGDLKRVKTVSERTIPAQSSSETFWKAFDEALAFAPVAG